MQDAFLTRQTVGERSGLSITLFVVPTREGDLLTRAEAGAIALSAVAATFRDIPELLLQPIDRGEQAFSEVAASIASQLGEPGRTDFNVYIGSRYVHTPGSPELVGQIVAEFLASAPGSLIQVGSPAIGFVLDGVGATVALIVTGLGVGTFNGARRFSERLWDHLTYLQDRALSRFSGLPVPPAVPPPPSTPPTEFGRIRVAHFGTPDGVSGVVGQANGTLHLRVEITNEGPQSLTLRQPTLELWDGRPVEFRGFHLGQSRTVRTLDLDAWKAVEVDVQFRLPTATQPGAAIHGTLTLRTTHPQVEVDPYPVEVTAFPRA